METRQRASVASGFGPLPINLKQWIDEVRLVHLSLVAVQALDPVETPGSRCPSDQEFPAPMMMTLLTYCFSIGLFGSHDIERSIASDSAVRYLCANQFPDANQIRSFRRRNTPQLKESLFNLFKIVWTRQFNDPSPSPYSLRASDPARHVPASPTQWERELSIEADLRIKMAMLIDSMALDE